MDGQLPHATSDEMAVKSAVEGLLAAMGTHDLDALPDMFAAEANIGIASLRDGDWTTSTMRFEQFLAELEAEIDPTPYTEPVAEFTVHVDRGRLAFVRADATLFVDGQAVRHNFDYFTLIKEYGTWKFVNASYVGTPAPAG